MARAASLGTIALALLVPAIAAATTVEARGWNATLDVATHRPAAIVPALTQGRDGYLYAASEAGLLRYDGHRFERLTAEEWPGMPSGEVLRVFAASDGAIWFSLGLGFVATQGRTLPARAEWVQRPGPLFRASSGRVARVALPIAQPDTATWAFAEQPGVGVWIGTDHGLVLAGKGGRPQRTFTVSDGLPDDFITSLAVGTDGDLWIGTIAGLARKRGTTIEIVARERPVLGLAFDGRALFVASGNEGFLVRDSGGREHKNPQGTWSLLATRDGRVLATQSGRIVRLARDGSPHPLDFTGALPDVIALAEDADGGIWVGTRASGLAQLTPRRLWNLGPLEGMTSNVPFAVLRAADGALWTTSTNAITRIDEGRLEHHRYGVDVPGWAARSIAQAPDGTLWIGDLNGGLLRRRSNGRFQSLSLMLPSDARNIRALTVTRAGDVLLGVGPTGLVRVRAATLAQDQAHVEVEPLGDGGLCRGAIAGLVEDASGTIWVGSEEGGVSKIDRDGPGRCTGETDGLPPGRIANLTIDARGTLWALTRRTSMLARWAGTRWEAIAIAPPDQPRELFGLVDDGEGHLWITSSGGMLRVDETALDRARTDGPPVPAQLFDVRDGMRSHECVSDFSPPGATDGRGRIWFPTLLGLVGLPTRDAPPRAPTQPRLELARSGGVRLPTSPNTELAIGPGRTDLELGFTAPTFVAPHRLTFEYRLVGVHDFRLAGPERRVVYAGLPHGRFAFEVRVRDEMGRLLAEPTQQAILVRPAWWQTRWFVAGITVATAALIVLLLRLRVRAVRGRYEAIHQERGRIARDLHDSLAQGFTSIGYHLDTAQTQLARSPKDVGPILSRARTILDHCHGETRRAIWNLRAQSAGRVSLADALARTIEEARAQGVGTVQLRVEGDPTSEPAIWEQEVPLIAQEAIANSFRHGGARRVDVTLTFPPHREGFRLIVRDDGRGLPATGPGPGGFGLFSMRDRSARFGGTVTLANHDGGGAELSVVVPGEDKDKS